jgi:hypothetical protein
MSALLWTVACLAAVLLVWAAVSGSSRVRRLGRLHVRMDAARGGLVAALDRRVAAALAAVRADGSACTDVDGGDLGGAGASAARSVWRAALAAREAGPEWSDREAAENRLGRALAGWDRATLAEDPRTELAEAEIGLVLARYVHNDAVRDTLGLRSRRLVRWLRLAGTAPLPRYFEIVDPPPWSWIGPEKSAA